MKLVSMLVELFQSHEKTLLEFSPGINAIIGNSQSGKTALLRAFLLLVTNRPSGTRFHSHFAPESSPTEISATTSDSLCIKLQKPTKGKAGYWVGDAPFTGFNKDVPLQVQEALPIIPELNIQEQLEEPFLITSKPGDVGKVINKITQLEKAQETIKVIEKWRRNSNQELNVRETDLLSYEEELKEYDFIDKAEESIDGFYESAKEHRALVDEVNSIIELMDELDVIEYDLAEYQEFIDAAEGPLDKGWKIVQQLGPLTMQIAELEKLINLEDDLAGLQSIEDMCRDNLAKAVKEFTRCPYCLSKLTSKQAKEMMDRL